MKEPYSDIIDRPYRKSTKHPPMPAMARAAQFAPSAALTGFDAEIAETARLTDSEGELSDDEASYLNEKLTEILSGKTAPPLVEITYFNPDSQKAGGAYITVRMKIAKIDTYLRKIVSDDGRSVDIDRIFALETVEEEF